MAARMWTSFVTDLNPNGHGGEFFLVTTSLNIYVPIASHMDDILTLMIRAVPHIPQWPRYSSKPANFVFRLPRNESYVEADTYRAAGMDYINSIAR